MVKRTKKNHSTRKKSGRSGKSKEKKSGWNARAHPRRKDGRFKRK